MKTYTKGLALLMATVMTVGAVAGCGKKTTTVKEQKLPEVTKQNVRQTIPETDIDFVKDGASDYVIVRPSEATKNETFAAEELQLFTKEATGAELPIVKESEAKGEGKYIYVGSTKASIDAGIKPTYEDVRTNGFVLKQADDDCYIVGNYDMGTRNAVYEFLTYMFDFEYYAQDEINLTSTKDRKMLAFDLTVKPDYELRDVVDGVLSSETNSVIGYRHRNTRATEIFINGNATHNAFDIVNFTTYDYQSPNYKFWYSNDGKEVTTVEYSTGEVKPAQLCYSNDEMRQVFTQNLIEKYLKDSTMPYMLLGAMDANVWCTCEKCSAANEKYGTDAATIIWFVNKVQADVNEWFAKNRPNDEPTKLIIFAYQKTVRPPVNYNKDTKQYEPMDDSVILNEDSGIYFAPISHKIHVVMGEEDVEDIKTATAQAQAWNALSKNIFCWVYSLLTEDCLIYNDAFEASQRNYQYLLKNNAIYIQDQGAYWMKTSNSGFLRLQTYVRCKVLWDTTLNMGELVDDFCRHYYGEAADIMQELFTQEREWMTHVYADTEATGSIGENMMDEKYWSYQQLQGYLSLIDQAYEKIEPLRESNPERYKQLYERILIESMQFRYIMLSLFSSEFDEAEALEQKLTFKKQFERLGMTSNAELYSVDILWKEWGIADY